MTESVTVPHELNRADERILEKLEEGRANPSYLADVLGYTRQYVHSRLQLLVAAEEVQNLGHGLYELADNPRDDATDQECVPDGGRIEHAIVTEAKGLEWDPFDCPECDGRITTREELHTHARECYGWDI